MTSLGTGGDPVEAGAEARLSSLPSVGSRLLEEDFLLLIQVSSPLISSLEST